MDRASELQALIREAREDYYNLTPKVPDSVYDAWVDELKLLAPDHMEVVAVGAAPPKISTWEKVRHEIPMGSLDKVNSETEFRAWASGTGADRFVIHDKVDGSSLEVVYEAGKLVRCVTRGDGIVGEDVTVNAARIPDIPKEIGTARAVIRGEVVLEKTVFRERYAAMYANPRNTAAGKLRDKKGNGADCEHLSFIAYSLLGAERNPTEGDQFNALRNLGFRILPWEWGNADTICQAFTKAAAGRDSIPYEIDGMVVRVTDLTLQERLGELNMRPRGQIAWKFGHPTGITRVNGVRWQVGTTGRVVPVASVDPVSIGGVTITSVSLHNLSMFRNLKLRPGSRVLVSRRNEVIPYIEQNLDETPVDQ